MSVFRAIKHQSHFSPVTLRFKDAELERRFHAVQYSIQPYAFQTGLGFLVLTYMVLAISQIFFADSSLVSNLGYVSLGLIALLSFSYMDNLRLKHHYQKLLTLLAVLLLGGVMLLAVLPGTQPVFHVTAMMLTLAWFWLLSGLSFANASIAGWSVIGIYGALVMLFGTGLGSNLAFVFNALLLGAIFATLASYLAERRLRIEFLSQHRVMQQSAAVPSHRRAATAANSSDADPGPLEMQLDNQIEWAKCLKQMTIELANINETELMFSRLLEHINKVMPFDAAAVGRFRNERMVPLLVRDKGANIAPDDTIKLLWNATLISQLRDTKESYIGEADVGLLETSIHDGELTFGCRLDIPFFSQQRLNGVVTLLRKRPFFNDFDKNLASSMVFHGMFARRSAGLQHQLENMAGKPAAERLSPVVEPPTAVKPSPKMLSADEFIEQAENTFRRLLASGQSVSLMLVELDQHESFMDKYGKVGRQQIFDTVVNVLQTCTAGRGLLGYYGKGSFAIQLPMSLALAKDVAENVRRTIESHVLRLDGSKTQVTVSIGVSSLSKSTLDFLSMLRCADLGLFMARDANGNTVRVNV